jgi:hypothetical protein
MQGVPVYVSTMSQDGEWKKKFPRGIAAFIGVVQMFLTLGILTCETISMLNGFKHGFLFIGYGTSFFFTITWITVYGSRKSRYCSMSDFLYGKKDYYICSLSFFSSLLQWSLLYNVYIDYGNFMFLFFNHFTCLRYNLSSKSI